MSAVLAPITVIQMPYVSILMGVSSVHVRKDSLEMELLAIEMVRKFLYVVGFIYCIKLIGRLHYGI